MNDIGRSFLGEALELLASYAFSKTVELEAVPVGVSATPEGEDDTTAFLHEFEARHALACAIRLKDIIVDIERRPSTNRTLRRTESRGTLRGRLDIPHYIARRSHQISLPRTYPIIVSEENARTPENALVVQALKGLAIQLGRAPFPRRAAEGQAIAVLYDWVRTRLRRMPWAGAARVDSVERLKRETRQRIRKRQTGNETSYGSLLEWFAEWQLDLQQLSSKGLMEATEGLLAFPIGGFFWEKVFEIWCLREIVRSLQRCNCTLIEGPRPLHKRGREPIYRLRHDGVDVEVWFQTQYPLGSPRWSYIASGHPLTGIPDVVVTRDVYSPLIVDAKLRRMLTPTRSDETYKMLGYLENFRDTLVTDGFQGLLAFVGPDAVTVLSGPNGSRLALIAVDELTPLRQHTEKRFDCEIGQWLESGHNNAKGLGPSMLP